MAVQRRKASAAAEVENTAAMDETVAVVDETAAVMSIVGAARRYRRRL